MKEHKTPLEYLKEHEGILPKTVGLAILCRLMEEYSDQQNAELRERVSKLETENKDYYLRVKELEFVGQVDSDCIESQSNEIDDLKAWKESAMKELNAIDLQSLGKKLGIGLGQSVGENVHAKIDGLLERVKELEKEVNDMTEFIPIYEGKIHKERCRADDSENRVKELEEAMNRIMEISITDTGRILSQSYGIAKEALKQQ